VDSLNFAAGMAWWGTCVKRGTAALSDDFTTWHTHCVVNL
jgi:hypothetical protein